MRTSGVRHFVLLLLDVIMVGLGFYIAFVIRFAGRVPMRNLVPFHNALPYITLMTLVLLWAFEVHDEESNRLNASPSRILMVVFLVDVGTMALTFWLRGFAFPRTIFVVGPVIQMTLLTLWRLVYRSFRIRVGGTHNIVVVGNQRDALDMVSALSAASGRWVRVEHLSSDQFEALAIAPDDTRLSQADVVYLGSSVPRATREELVAWCLEQDKQVCLVPDLYDIALHQTDKWNLDDMPLFSIRSLALSPVQKTLKRVEDIVLGSVLALVALVVSPFIAVAIKLTSRGPVLYQQERVGQNGRSFYIQKFRTMVVDAEQKSGPVFATRKDPRITPVGRFLRATRLDEIPQVLNILKGEMSFVGPRPERPSFVRQFAETIPAYSYRLKVKPGVTGLAQVRGRYDSDPASKLRYDLYYIRNFSLLLDLKILFQTVLVVLRPESARGVSDAAHAKSGVGALGQ